MYGDKKTNDSEQEHEHGDAALEYCAEPLRLSRMPELRYIYRVSHHVLRVFQHRQRIFILFVDTNKQGAASTGFEASKLVGWNTARGEQFANLLNFSGSSEDAE